MHRSIAILFCSAIVLAAGCRMRVTITQGELALGEGSHVELITNKVSRRITVNAGEIKADDGRVTSFSKGFQARLVEEGERRKVVADLKEADGKLVLEILESRGFAPSDEANQEWLREFLRILAGVGAGSRRTVVAEGPTPVPAVPPAPGAPPTPPSPTTTIIHVGDVTVTDAEGDKAADWTWMAWGGARFGSSNRVAAGCINRREHGEVADASLGAAYRLHSQDKDFDRKWGHLILAAEAGTDEFAEDSGKPYGMLSLTHCNPARLVDLALAEVDLGYSAERKLLLGADLFLIPLHVGVDCDDEAKQYSLGFGYSGTPLGSAKCRISWDRTITYADGDGHRLGSHLWLEVTERVFGPLWVGADLHYYRHALDDDRDQHNVWTGGVGAGLVF